MAEFELHYGKDVTEVDFYYISAFTDAAGVYYLQGQIVENSAVMYEACLRQTSRSPQLSLATELPTSFNQIFPLDDGQSRLAQKFHDAIAKIREWGFNIADNTTHSASEFANRVGIPFTYSLFESGFAGAIEEAVSFRNGRP